MEVETSSAAIGAAGVLLGALIAQFGTVIKLFYDDGKAKKEIKRAKLEELYDCIHKTNSWIRETEDLHYDPEFDAHIPLSASAHRAHVLALLYFKDLQPTVARLLNETMRFHNAVVSYRPGSEQGGVERENIKRAINHSIDELDKSCTQVAKTLI